MNHKQFLNKWIGRKYQESPELGYQCVSLIKLYCNERGFPIRSFGWSAINWWNTGCPFNDRWERVEKTMIGYPKEWDIVFFSGWEYGHVAIANKFCNPAVLRTIDQNAYTWNGKWEWKDAITPYFRGYSNVLGWYTLIK